MITNTKVYNLEEAIIASGYPMLSDKNEATVDREVNQKDIDRAKKLGNTPKTSGHGNYLKSILVSFDIEYTQYFSMQFERYQFLQIGSSTSKMHRLTKGGIRGNTNSYVDEPIIDYVDNLIKEYNECEDKTIRESLFMRIMSNCPMGLLQKMHVTTNYMALANVARQREHHRLSEWKEFVRWCRSLPRFTELTGV